MRKIQLWVEPAGGADKRELMNKLFVDLQGRHDVQAVREPAPDGSRGDGAAIVELVLHGLIAAGGMQAFTKIVVAFLQHQEVRSIVLKSGDNVIEVQGGTTKAAQREALEAWLGTTPES
jgi:hypothetical protein